MMHGTPALCQGIARPGLGDRRQMDIGDQQLDPFYAQPCFGFFSLLHASGGDDAIALHAQHLYECLAHRLLIVNDEDGKLRATVPTPLSSPPS
jgi:hypothetical protein